MRRRDEEEDNSPRTLVVLTGCFAVVAAIVAVGRIGDDPSSGHGAAGRGSDLEHLHRERCPRVRPDEGPDRRNGHMSYTRQRCTTR